ncbi:MAG: BamA/TamA family outer membrane protein [bacterium]
MKHRFAPRAMALAAIPFVSLRAQQAGVPTRPAVAPSGRATAACTGQRIDDIVVYSEAPSVANLQRVPVLARIARETHATTRPDIIRRFMLLDETQPCDELRRAESERILRAQPFIADADIFVIPNDHGGVDLEVRTSDEVSIVIGGSVRARAPNVSFLLLGNANLAGQGVFLDGAWRTGDGLRDAFSGRVVDNQFLGHPWVFGADFERATLGGSWRLEGAQPFLTDLQRVAWRVRAGLHKEFFELRMPNRITPTLPSERKFFDVGGIVRVGPPGRLGLLGASLTGEDEATGARLILPEDGVLKDVGPTPRVYSPHRIARVNLLWGVRNINYVRRQGLDALTATQDVPLGFQFGSQVGRSLTALGAREDDSFLAGDLYLGLASASGRGILRIQGQGEGRRAAGGSQWDGVLTTGRITHYYQFSPVSLNQVIVEWSGGYRQRTPFQLILGIPEGGVRGYEESALAGGQRVVARIEQRHLLGKAFNLADVGTVLFADAGRLWAGDVPFGQTTPVKTSVGFSILAAVPMRSARMWRADFAFPLNSGANARWTIKFTNVDRTQFVFREARDVAIGRELTVPSSIFAWP